jgi:hypothetical protein
MNNQGTIINGQNGSEKQPSKGGFKGFVDGIHKKYDAIRYSKGGKWAARLLTLAAIGGTGKVCYDKGMAKGKASVVPTVVTIERTTETEPEAAPEESTVEEA